MSIPIALIVACGNDNVIGLKGQMPWHIPEDLRYFKEKTLHKPIIMGRKTFLSLKKPLPERFNIVLTRQPLEVPEGVKICNQLDEALKKATDFSQKSRVDEIMIIGGAQVYQQTLSFATRIYFTQIDIAITDGDAFFPKIDERHWQLTQASAFKESPSGRFRFCVYERMNV